MRALVLFLPAVLMAQTAPPKSGTSSPAPAKSTPAPSRAAPAKAPSKAPAAAGLTTDEQKTVYSVGLSMYRSLTQLDLSPAELELVKQALSDAAAGKPAVKLDEWGPKIQALAQARASRVAQREKASSAAFLTKAATETGAVKTPSGLVYRELQAGSGASPKATDTVKVNYRGTFIDGKEFDSSYGREPAQFALNQVIKCWTEGVQKMKVGGKGRLVCPSDIAYGDQGRPSIPGGATLVFEIELLDIVKTGQ